MIEYNIIKKRFTPDAFALQEGVYNALENKLVNGVKEILLPYEDKLNEYHVVVNLDLNESKMNIISKDLPDGLHKELNAALQNLPNTIRK